MATPTPPDRPVLSPEEQLEEIRRGTEEIFPEEELLAKLRESYRTGRPLRVKLGIDPTAQDLHLGHIIPVLQLRRFQQLGHQAVLIIGDYTGMVGDPSGRKGARPQLTHEQVLANSATYREQVFRFLDPERTEVVYNGQWFSKMSFADVMRLLSRMTVARTLEREDFAERIRQQVPISLHELVYPLMQGWDSVMVRADVELGGIDQKFNILVGRELQKDEGLPPQVGVCNPILIGLDGKEKMSKSLGNSINLSDPPDQVYGKTMSLPDELIWTYFELATEVPTTELRRMRAELEAGRLHPRDAKARLARELTARLHGTEAALQAERAFDAVFRRGDLPEEMPMVRIPAAELREGRIWLPRLLVLAEMAPSLSEARRLLQQGGVRINGETAPVDPERWELEPPQGLVVQVGKRRFARIEAG